MNIGLYFGSFNPIHVGHLIIANHMLEYGNLDQLWFVVSPHNPLKEKKTLLSDHHRLMLVKEAVEDNPKMRASDVEFSLTQPSYTAKTLMVLSEKYPQHRFTLIMGEDNLKTIHKWYNYTYLLDNYSILVYPRLCPSQLPTDTNSLIASYPTITLVENAPLMNLSSSFIRQSIRNGKNVQYLLPDSVYNYVQEMRFYQ